VSLLTTDSPDDKEVRCIVVRASVLASMNATHYVTRILFTENELTGQWEATKQMKNRQCVSGSELEKLWCTHVAGVFAALAKLAPQSPPVAGRVEDNVRRRRTSCFCRRSQCVSALLAGARFLAVCGWRRRRRPGRQWRHRR
jgi:hypothetical protein